MPRDRNEPVPPIQWAAEIPADAVDFDDEAAPACHSRYANYCPECGFWQCADDNAVHGYIPDGRPVGDEVVFRRDRTGIDNLVFCAAHAARYTGVCAHCLRTQYTGWLVHGGCTYCMKRCDNCGNWFDPRTRHNCLAHNPFTVAGIRPQQAASVIMNYTYKPDPVFHGKSRNNLFYGIEQEVESRDGNAEAMVKSVLRLDKDKLLYAKSDSSMFQGAEFVSHPMTFAWFTANYPEKLGRKLEELASNEYAGQFTTGVHIHASREAFTGYHLFKFMQFFLLNPEFIKEIAGRGDTADDARRGTHKIAAYEKDALFLDPETGHNRIDFGRAVTHAGDVVYSADAAIRNWAYAGKQQQHPWTFPANRYVAVNLQNRATVEVRVFRGTVKIERLRAYMQFMDAVYRFTDEAHWRSKDVLHGLTEVGFKAFVEHFPHRYSDLQKLMAREGRWAEA